MIVADSSALFAVIQTEPEAETFFRVLRDNDVLLPASVVVEASITAITRGLGADLADIVATMRPKVISLDESMARLAVEAFRRYGKGRHKASLNFGDCLVYATAKRLDLPLLYKCQDFASTDLKSALPLKQ
jgi:ribonuclease VapC